MAPTFQVYFFFKLGSHTIQFAELQTLTEVTIDNLTVWGYPKRVANEMRPLLERFIKTTCINKMKVYIIICFSSFTINQQKYKVSLIIMYVYQNERELVFISQDMLI